MKSSPPTSVARRYTLKREIGRGGMGAVWLAVDEVLGREVAIKRVGLFPGGSSPDLLRAQREAKLAASLNHPHVVSVFDFVSDGDEQWLVMEYVPGTNLSVMAEQRGGLPPDEAAAVLGQVAEALSVAHSAGIVHRDVKPSNILVTEDGAAKLADFGIARARADSTLTGTGMVTGSPAYLAPEVASGHAATEASDVWSLGATLFHTLTGRPPYDVNDNVLAAMYRIVHEEPPRLPDDGWPAELLETTMATDPADRWSMARVQQFLTSGAGAAADATTADASPTAMLPAVAPLASDNPPLPPPEPEPELIHFYEEPEPALDEDRTRSRAPVVLLVLAAAAIVLGLVVWTSLRDDDSPSANDTPAATRSAEPTGEASPKGNEPDPRTSAPETAATSAPSEGGSGDAAAMADFVRDYVATAVRDPEAGWELLTPRFQQEVGSFGSYQGFWNTIESASLRDVEANTETMEVSCVITWDPKGRGPEDENVVLTLVEDDGGYLIDAER